MPRPFGRRHPDPPLPLASGKGEGSPDLTPTVRHLGPEPVRFRPFSFVAGCRCRAATTSRGAAGTPALCGTAGGSPPSCDTARAFPHAAAAGRACRGGYSNGAGRRRGTALPAERRPLTLGVGLAWPHARRGGGRITTITPAGGGQHLPLADMVGRPHHAVLLHLFDQLRRAVVADVQMPLDEGGRGLAFAHHQFHRTVVQRGVGIGIATDQPGGAAGLRVFVLFCHFLKIGGLSLAAQPFHHPLHLGIGNKGAMHPLDPPALAHEQHVALAEQLFRPLFAEDGAGIDLRGDGEGDARREIRLDGAGDHIHRRPLRGHDDMDAGGARHLRQPLHGGLDLLACHQHQIRHLVDHDDDHRQGGEGQRLLLKHRLAGLGVEAGLHAARQHLAAFRRLCHLLVVAGDVAHPQLRHRAVAALHLAHRPFQRADCLGRLRHHRGQQMRDAIVDRQLQHLRVDHDEAHLLRREAVEEGEDHGVDADRFARAGGARDQQMRHAGKIGVDRCSTDVLAEGKRQPPVLLRPVGVVQHLAEEHRLPLWVRQFDANDVARRHAGDAYGNDGHRARDVVREADDTRRLGAGAGSSS